MNEDDDIAPSAAITSLDAAKEEIERLARRVKSMRLTRTELMAVLAKVYAIRLTTADQRKLMDYVIEYRKFEGANRAFLLRQNNEYMLPLRYVFPAVEDRANVSRYAGALRELRRMDVPEHQFHQAVKANGGLVDLYWNGRARETKRQIRSKLTLDRNIEVRSGQEIVLRLLPQPSGVFKVLSCENAITVGKAA